MSLRDWSIGRMFLVSVLWALGVILFTALRTFTFMRGQAEHDGIVGVSAGSGDLLKLAGWVLIPPIVLFTTWLVQRRQ